MADENTPAMGNETTDPVEPTAGADAQAGNSEDPQAELTKMREALKKANAEAKKYRLEADEREKAKTKAEQDALAEQGKFKELYEKQQADLAKAQADAKAANLRILRREAAEKAKLPLALADRLQGETEEELLADAKAMLAALPKPAAPNTNAADGNGASPTPGKLSDVEKREKAARYGVKPEFYNA